MAPKPDAFLSYTRFDDDYSGGAISEFRQRLEMAVRAVTGKPFHIFQDIGGIGLGGHWPDKLDQMLDQARFFIPILTPSFFESKPCRRELERFREAERKADRKDLILPIYYLDCAVLEEETLRSEDELAALIHERQRYDWRELRHEPYAAKEVRKSLEALARQMASARRRVLRVVAENQGVAVAGGSSTSVRLVEVTTPQPAQRLFEPGTIFRDADEPWCPEMVVIPPGRFQMGSPKGKGDDDERLPHEVVFAQPFALGRFPVTFEEYDSFCEQVGRKKPDDMKWGRGRRPVINVRWGDARAYCKWLSEITEQSYRLPSEAEWEYGCRAGTTTGYAFGDQITEKQANFGGNVMKTTEVGNYPANSWELHDMHGNVWEWVEDSWNDSYEGAPTDGSAWLQGDRSARILRGGSWYHLPAYLRSALRNSIPPGVRVSSIGFRVARTLAS